MWWLREGTSGVFRDLMLRGAAEARSEDHQLWREGEDEEAQVNRRPRPRLIVPDRSPLFNRLIWPLFDDELSQK